MGFILTLIEGIFSFVGWIRGNKDQRIGKEEQQNTDLTGENVVLRKELKDAINKPTPDTVLDSLRNHDF